MSSFIRNSAKPIAHLRHGKLFELIRQQNSLGGAKDTAVQSQDQTLEALKAMACASLGR